MRKWFLLVFVLCGYNSIGQTDSIYARIEITSVSLQEHRTWIDTSIIITLEKFGHSEIIALGKIDSIEVGIQIELYKSHLGDTDLFVNGKAYYLKKEGKWQMYYQPTYQSREFKIVSSKPLKMPDDYGMGSMGIQGLQVDYKEYYFIIR